MKRGIFGRIKMLLLEIKFDKIRPRREYWRPLGKHSDSFSVSFGSELGFEVSVSLLFFFSPLHNVHFVKYDGPVVKMALYMLQGHIM